MSGTKFTKGEWVVKGTSMSMGSNYRGKFTVESSGFSGNISEANIANAHLIKVAPEMYKFIESLQLSVADSIKRDELLKEARGEK
ncbi:hypothetical protein [Pseudoalteromonas phage C7]|uniref:hypothetical protein n=1 Tax=Pseudoalteromonas phage C7 TaxID=2510494 RepID=UPI0010180E35|nr:hypothetical protein PP587_gp23 [Pseudoalteromonas phage C7]QAY17977.1 hypothetical protein [Pseudoalteromonas phage C7]